MNTQNSHCWVSCIGFFILWWLIASALLMITWNKVIGTVAKVKTVKFWHTLVLILTVSFICVIPKMCMSRYGHGGCGSGSCAMHGYGGGKGGCARHSDCAGKGDCGGKGDCDYHGKKDAGSKE